MKLPRIIAVIGVLVAFATSPLLANPVLDWNNTALNITRLARTPPPMSSLFLATMHAAVFDAVNGIEGKHASLLIHEPAPAGASVDAAIAGAAHTVIKKLWGASVSAEVIAADYQKALAAIPDGPAKTAGLAWGQHVAELVLAQRADCGFDKPIPGQYASTEVGKWRETPPGFRPPVLPHWAKVRPFVMASPSQFRPPAPYPINSKEHADDLAYVVKVGARDDAERTEAQTLSTTFWSDDLGTCTPPGHWNLITQDLARRYKLSVPETARLFALLNLAEADACIACWDAKFFYSIWRPETAIRELSTKDNPHWTPRPDFIPLMMTPAFPTYTSGHSTFSGAAARLLERYFGTDDIEFTTTSDGQPGAVRTFKKLSECRDEVGMSRVYGGIHTMQDNIEGFKCGAKVADWVLDHALLAKQ